MSAKTGHNDGEEAQDPWLPMTVIAMGQMSWEHWWWVC
jgi:hypothetical protein